MFYIIEDASNAWDGTVLRVLKTTLTEASARESLASFRASELISKSSTLSIAETVYR